MHTHTKNFHRVSLLLGMRMVIAMALLSLSVLHVPLADATGVNGRSDLLVNTESFDQIDQGDSTSDRELRFGSSSVKLLYSVTNARFEFSSSIRVTGDVRATGTLSGAMLHITGTGSSPLITTDQRFGSILMGTGSLRAGGSGSVAAQLFIAGGRLKFMGSVTASLSNPRFMALADRTAFVTDAGGSLAVIDVSNPNMPTSLASTTTGLSTPNHIVVRGRYAYVTDDGNETMNIFDISNPKAPTFVSTTTTGTNPQSIAVQGQYAYVVSQLGNSLTVFDVSNPSTPVQMSSTTTNLSSPYGLAVQGRYAYVPSRNDGALRIFDISNPSSIVFVGTVSTGLSLPLDVAVQGRYAYVADVGNSSIVTFDISDPTAPAQISSISTNLSAPSSVTVTGRYIYVASSNNRAVIFDISNPQVPVFLTYTTTGINGISEVVAQGRYVYAVNGTAHTVVIFDAGGEFTQSLEAGSVETANLSVRNDLRANQASFKGGVSVQAGLNVNGNTALNSVSGSVLTLTTSDRTNKPVLRAVGTISGTTLRVSAGGADIQGNLTASGTVRFDQGLTLNDDLTAADTVLTFGHSTTNGTVTYGNAFTEFSFNRGIRVGGNISGSGNLMLEAGGTLSGSIIRGFGFNADCSTDASQKLLWNSTTGRFSCGTDQTGGGTAGSFVRTSGDTMTGALTVQNGNIHTPPSTPLLNVRGTMSGSNIHAQTGLTSSGSLAVTGNITMQGNTLDFSSQAVNVTLKPSQAGLNFDSNTLVIDSSLNRVGVGTVAPRSEFDVVGTISGSMLRSSSGAMIDGGTLYADAVRNRVGVGNLFPRATLDVRGVASGSTLRVSGNADVHGVLAASGAVRFDDNLTLNDNLTAADVTLTFGNSVTSGVVTYGNAFREFSFNTGIRVGGNISGSGNLMLEAGGTLSGSIIRGFGFDADCSTDASQKLLWNSTTGRFSCGTDQGGAGGVTLSSADARYVNASGDTMTGGLVISRSTADIVRTTSGTTATTDFFQTGYSQLNIDSWNDLLSIQDGAVPSNGQGTMSTSTTALSATSGRGSFTIIRDDGKYIIVHGNGRTTGSLWDGLAGGTLSATTTAPGNAAINSGAIALRRTDGRYMIVNGGGATTSSVFDPYGITATAAGPTLTSCTAAAGTNAFQVGSGGYVILCGGSGNWGTYNPSAATAAGYNAGTALATNFGVGALTIQRDDGTFLVFQGGNTTNHYIYNSILQGTVGTPWSTLNPISGAPTIGSGAIAIRRADGKFLIAGGEVNKSTIYDPTPSTANPWGTFTAQTGAGYGPTTNLRDAAQAIWRQDGKYLIMIGSGSTVTNIYNPDNTTAGQFTTGPTLPGAMGQGGHAFIRTDGKVQIFRGGGTTTSDTYNMGYIVGGPSTSTGAVYTTECITANSTGTGSRLFWNANSEGKITFEVRTGNGSCSGNYRFVQKSGDYIKAASGDNRVQVRVTFYRSLPRFADQEWGLRRGMGQTRYRRVNQDNALYDFRISNSSLVHRSQFEFGNSTKPSGPVSVNIVNDRDRANQLSLEVIQSAYRTTTNTTNQQIYHGATTTHPALPTAATMGTVVLKRPDGKFVIIPGGGTTPTAILYDPVNVAYATNASVPTTTTGSGAMAFKRPDGKFLITMGNTKTTNIYDPVANTFSAGPNLVARAGEGAFGIPMPNGRIMIAHGGFQRTTSLYDPYSNTFSSGASMTLVIGRGSLPIPRPDGKWFIVPGTSSMACALQTATILFDPYTQMAVTDTNAPVVTGTGPGATAFQRSDGQWVILKGGGTANTCAALTSINVYNPAINRMWASAATATTRYGAQVIQRPDNTWLILPGGAGTATQIYYEKAGTFVTDSSGNPGGLVITGPTLTTATGTGSLIFQREDGKYVIINGANAVASAGTTTTLQYDAGWVTSGFYRSENMYIPDLGSNSTLTWRASTNPSDISAEVRTATGELMLQTAPAREVPVSGARINASSADRWAQVQFNMRRSFPLFCGLSEDACYTGGLASVIPFRSPTVPTITDYGINQDNDLIDLQADKSSVFRVSTNGDVYAGSKGSVFSGGADLAERYSSPDVLEPGEVVSLDYSNDHSVRRATKPYQSDLLGVVSTNPGFVAGTYTKGSFPVALVGRVPVKVTSEGGDIIPGDRLVAASKPGYAMKAQKAGRTVGIAMSGSDPAKMKPCDQNKMFQNTLCGEVMMFVNLSDYAGPVK